MGDNMRIDQIMELIEAYSRKYSFTDLKMGKCEGISVYELAEELHMLRNNVTVEVNKLFDADKIIKIKGKTIRYFSKEFLMKISNRVVAKNCICSSLKELIEETYNLGKVEDIFEELIGYEYSLKKAVNLAKAAILYPKKPLHTLIIGESGTGKSLFAEKMFHYGIQKGIFPSDSKLIVFNCADYANNPNLLLSYLFGSKKGSYTDSLEDRPGLIESADNGMLFLDEVHRLPPEGQEMLFYFLDKKKFRRLGEADVEREANVTFVLATTEDPDNVLLETFLRRIEMIIQIPNLHKKSFIERKQLIFELYAKEANHIEYPVRIDRDVLMKLLNYYPKGNIGQLKNDIKLTIANAFMEMQTENLTELNIQLNHLPQYIFSKLSESDEKTRQQCEILLSEESYLIAPFDVSYRKMSNLPILYNKKAELNQKENFIQFAEEIRHLLINHQLDAYLDDSEILDLMLLVSEWSSYHLDKPIDRSQNIALAIYLKNIMNKSYHSEYEASTASEEMIKKAGEFMKYAENQIGFKIPHQELEPLAKILELLSSDAQKRSKDLIFVIAHGTSAAQSIAQAVNDLLAMDSIIGYDVPLTENVLQILPLIAQELKSRKIEKAILFVDLVSMMSIEEMLKNQYDIQAIVIPTVNLLIVLETARKLILMNYQVSDVLIGIKANMRKLDRVIDNQIDSVLNVQHKKIIYTVCRSNEGTAFFLKKHLESIFAKNNVTSIEVEALQNDRINHLKEMIHNKSNGQNILAIVGTVDLEIEGIPFVSLYDILFGNGIDFLFSFVHEVNAVSKQDMVFELKKETQIDITLETINKYLYYFDAKKLYFFIEKYIRQLEESLEVVFDNSTMIDLIVHLSYLIERLVTKDYEFTHTAHNETLSNLENKIERVIHSTISYLETKFNIYINDQEISHIVKIIQRDSNFVEKCMKK